MPVFSYTAPLITREEEEQEWNELTDEMKKEIRAELYGMDQPPSNVKNPWEHLEATIPKYINALHDAIDDLPLANKKDYLEAIHRVPELVNRETNPIKFLRGTKCNVSDAAFKLASYWKMRIKLFGPNRAFLPMTLKGAIADDLNILLSQNLVAILPKDEHGRRVFFFDRIRAISPYSPRNETLRILFYMFHVLSDDVTVQRDGYVFVQNIMRYDVYKHFDRILTKQQICIILECMPMKVKSFHLVAGSANGVVSLILPVFKHILRREIRIRLIEHEGTTATLKDGFATFGLIAKHLPEVLGGEWTAEHLLEWCDRQGTREEEQEVVSY